MKSNLQERLLARRNSPEVAGDRRDGGLMGAIDAHKKTGKTIFAVEANRDSNISEATVVIKDLIASSKASTVKIDQP